MARSDNGHNGFGAALRSLMGKPGKDDETSTRGVDSDAVPMAGLTPEKTGRTTNVDPIDSDLASNAIGLEPDPGKKPDLHARRMLAWLQAPGGMTGQALAADLQAMYVEMAAELGWHTLSWLRVGQELALITGPRTYRYFQRNGKTQRLRTYAIPHEGIIASTQERARQSGAPLVDRIALLERTTSELNDRVAELTGLLRNSVESIRSDHQKRAES